MGLFKRCQHPLPNFPPNAIPLFRSYCEVIPLAEFSSVREEVNAGLEKCYQDAYAEKTVLDQIKKACNVLIDAYENVNDESKGLIIGALRYCCIAEDAMSDELFAAGYIDDCKILNHVLEKLGIEGCFIRFGH